MPKSEAVTPQDGPKRKPRAVKRLSGRPGADAPAIGRDTIVECACELLRKLPPGKITRSEVARLAGVDPSLARYYFRDGQSMLLAVAERLTEQFAHRVERFVAASDGTPQEALKARIRSLMALQVEYPYFHQLIAQEVVKSDDPTARRLMEKLTDGGMRAYQTIIDCGVADRTMRAVDGQQLFLAVVGMCESFVTGFPMLRFARGKTIDMLAESRRYEEFICELVLRGVLARS